MTESFGFKLTLDAAGANRALDETRKKAESLGGAKESLGKQLGAMKEKLEKSAGAFAALSLAMGQTNDTTGKAISSVGQLVAAYGAGGPLAVALAVGAAGVSALTHHWDDLIKAQDAALAKTFETSDRMLARSRQISDELHKLTTSATGDRRQGIQNDLASLQAQLTAKTGAIGQLTGPLQQDMIQQVITLKRTMDAMKADLRNLDKIDAATAPKPLAEKPVDTAAAEEEALRAVQKVFYGQRLEANKRYHEQIIQNAKEAAEEELKVAEAAAKEQQKIDDQIAREGGEELMNAFLDRDKQMQDARAATAKAEMDAQRSATMELTQLSGSLAMALGSATAATFQGIEGQKAAFESLVSSASQAIGGYIMMKGGQVLAEGIASELALPGNPLGIAQIAGGTGLIAAGAAIQTGGPMAVQALMGKSGAASGGAATGGGAGTTDAGASTLGRSSSGSYRGRGSGNTIINITYGGASGPTAEQGAQAVVQSLRRAGRRGLTPLEVR